MANGRTTTLVVTAAVAASGLLAACGSSRPSGMDNLLVTTLVYPDPLPAPAIPTSTTTANLEDPYQYKFVPADDNLTVLALGDSYGAGEGNPVAGGSYDPDGALYPGFPAEKWAGSPGAGLPASGNERCHRSDRSGAAKAVARIKTAVPAINLQFTSYACSGAVSTQLTTDTYEGADQQAIRDAVNAGGPARLAPQVTDSKGWATGKRIDVVTISIGGNDALFGKLVAACFVLPGDCRSGSDAIAALDALRTIPDKIATVASAVRAAYPEAWILFSAYPDPLSVSGTGDSNGDGICSADDSIIPSLLLWKADPMWAIRTADAFWLRDQFLPQLNAQIKEGVTRAKNLRTSTNTAIPFGDRVLYLDGHYVGRSGNHGYCSAQPNIRFNVEALSLQGCDPDLGISWMACGFGQINFSKGGWHPNDFGYERYADSIQNAINQVDPRVGARAAMFTRRPVLEAEPAKPTGVTVKTVLKQTTLTGGYSYTYNLVWNDKANNEENYQIVFTQQITGGRTDVVSVPRNSTAGSFTVYDTVPYVVSVSACHDHLRTKDLCGTEMIQVLAPAPPPTPGASTCTVSYKIAGGTCLVKFVPPPAPWFATAAAYASVEVYRYDALRTSVTLLGRAYADPSGATAVNVTFPYGGEAVGTSVSFGIRGVLCTKGLGCTGGPLTRVTATVSK